MSTKQQIYYLEPCLTLARQDKRPRAVRIGPPSLAKIFAHIGLAVRVGVHIDVPVQGSPFGLVLEQPHGNDVLHKERLVRAGWKRSLEQSNNSHCPRLS